MSSSSFDYVLTKLDETKARDGIWRKVSRESGVPYSTITRIARRMTKNPTFHTIEKLARTFRDQDSA